MSESTSNLALPYILSAQAQKHVTHNEALRHLDALVHLSVVSKTQATPPTDPPDGDRYIVASGASDVWAGKEDAIAAFQDGAWAFHQPKPGWLAWIQDQAGQEVFDGAAWIDPGKIVPSAAHTINRTIDEHLSLAGEITVAATEIPDRAIVLGVSVRVLETIEGATSFDVGIEGDIAKFGGSLGTAAGNTNIGVIGPHAVYEPTPIQLTANGGPFASGTIALALHFIQCGPPAL
ncbi:MAG: DUF2793 domain-containing protein [Rhizobiaceae bacterium]|nr:DUF2793 domain-containing protein [Hyphomicrobiales bacterium]NRB29000.1 DUF2793 domain-containing protein [Rhizobiaceae bacterium]